MINKKIFFKFWQKLKDNDNYLLTTHINPDGDGICSILIFAIILKLLKKKYFIVMEDMFPEKLKFLLNEFTNYLFPEFINIPKGLNIKTALPENFIPKSLIIIDSCGNDRLGKFANDLPDLKLKFVFNVDHHNGKRRFPGPVDLIDIKASATAEIIFNLLKTINYKITKEIAKLVYISIITDTKNFTQSNTTAECHMITSELIRLGVNPEEVQFQLQEIPSDTLKIYAKVINRFQLKYNDKLIWSYITNPELKKCINKDTEGLIEILRDVKNTKLVILLKEVASNKVKVSLRGKNGFDVFRIAKEFNGGGHLQAAGFNIDYNLKKSINILFKAIEKFM